MFNPSLLSLDPLGLSSQHASILIKFLYPMNWREGSKFQHRSFGHVTKHRGLTLLGYLQLEVVHIRLKGLVAGGQLVDVSLDDFHSREKSCRVVISAVFGRGSTGVTCLGGPLARMLCPCEFCEGEHLLPATRGEGDTLYHLLFLNGIFHDITRFLWRLSPARILLFQRYKRHDWMVWVGSQEGGAHVS